jgi:hypothetical protein
MTSSGHRHAENCPDSEAMRDFPWGATRSFKPLHKICDFDLMVRRAHPRRTPSQNRTVPRYLPPIRSYAMPTGLCDGLVKRASCDLRCMRGTVKVLNGHAARTNRSKSRSTPAKGNHARDPVAAYHRSRQTAKSVECTCIPIATDSASLIAEVSSGPPVTESPSVEPSNASSSW